VPLSRLTPSRSLFPRVVAMRRELGKLGCYLFSFQRLACSLPFFIHRNARESLLRISRTVFCFLRTWAFLRVGILSRTVPFSFFPSFQIGIDFLPGVSLHLGKRFLFFFHHGAASPPPGFPWRRSSRSHPLIYRKMPPSLKEENRLFPCNRLPSSFRGVEPTFALGLGALSPGTEPFPERKNYVASLGTTRVLSLRKTPADRHPPQEFFKNESRSTVRFCPLPDFWRRHRGILPRVSGQHRRHGVASLACPFGESPRLLPDPPPHQTFS